MDTAMLRDRARIIKQVRSFFDGKHYLELDTPLLAPNLIPESCLEVFQTNRIIPSGINGKPSSQPYWLIPSPEIWMKQIIARHQINVYQICKCFRNGESCGFLHSPEFTMLEYYTINADYLDSLALTEELFASFNTVFNLPFERMTVAQAFARYAGFDLFAAAGEPGAMEAEARRLGLDPSGLETAVLYDLIFIHAVEPHLSQDRPVALLDYPAFVPTLAKHNTDGKTSQRWELYYKGIELANCFTEETDSEKVRDFFISQEHVKKQTSLVPHNVDHHYHKHFDSFPACSGVALGLDRLIMAICGKSTIDSVLPFPMS